MKVGSGQSVEAGVDPFRIKVKVGFWADNSRNRLGSEVGLQFGSG